MSLTFPVDAKLKDGSSVQLVLADNQDIEPLRRLYRVIVEEGTSYPHDHFPDKNKGSDPVVLRKCVLRDAWRTMK